MTKNNASSPKAKSGTIRRSIPNVMLHQSSQRRFRRVLKFRPAIGKADRTFQNLLPTTFQPVAKHETCPRTPLNNFSELPVALNFPSLDDVFEGDGGVEMETCICDRNIPFLDPLSSGRSSGRSSTTLSSLKESSDGEEDEESPKSARVDLMKFFAEEACCDES
mmetsp:Transcript_8163/g.15058  ORF Transcript_8163/g.15058 Transcript_8163/m.15058 type:complete len:164 (+) Transcript_8163:83-574(+)